MCENREVQWQGKVGVVQLDIIFDFFCMLLIVVDFFDFQCDLVICQNLLYDFGNYLMFIVILIKGQGEVFQVSWFFVFYGVGMVLMGEQFISWELQLLVLFFSEIDQISWRKYIVYLVFDLLICFVMGAVVEQ